MDFKIPVVIITIAALVLLFQLPQTAQAASVEELLALIAQLKTQIAELQKQLQQIQGQPVAWCHDFTIAIRFGDSGREVLALQTALQKEGFFVGSEVDGSSFGEQTASAVVGFQQKYRKEILTPAGLKFGTGFVGKATRAKLNALYACAPGQPSTPKPPSVVIQPPPPPPPTPPPPSPTTPTITVLVLSPNGGEQLKSGGLHNITWSTNALAVNIELWKGTAFIQHLAIGVEGGKGLFPWSIPLNLSSGNDYKIYVSVMNAGRTSVQFFDSSDALFSIIPSSTPPPPPPPTPITTPKPPVVEPPVITTLELKSNFFKDDPIAKSIVDGINYQLKDANYLTSDGKRNTLSFEYKIITALRQLGYSKLVFSEKPGDIFVGFSLHSFQKKHTLPIIDLINKNLMFLLDFELAEREKLDKGIAEQYPPFIKFINVPANEPPKEHLAALLAAFYAATPKFESPDLKGWTLDEFRWALISMGGNLGRMLNPEGTRVLTPNEAVEVRNNKGDFRFCSNPYYYVFRDFSKSYFEDNTCVNPLTFVQTDPLHDIGYVALYTHEYGHAVSREITLVLDGITDKADVHFGKISFYKLGNRWFWVRPGGDNGEFVSGYARTGPSNELDPSTYSYPDYFIPSEDFAESFSAYVLTGNIFRENAKSNIYLNQKYDFLKKYVFKGLEYKTGDVKSLNLWKSKNKGIPDHPEDYLTGDPDFIWDATYPNLLR